MSVFSCAASASLSCPSSPHALNSIICSSSLISAEGISLSQERHLPDTRGSAAVASSIPCESFINATDPTLVLLPFLLRANYPLSPSSATDSLTPSLASRLLFGRKSAREACDKGKKGGTAFPAQRIESSRSSVAARLRSSLLPLLLSSSRLLSSSFAFLREIPCARDLLCQSTSSLIYSLFEARIGANFA